MSMLRGLLERATRQFAFRRTLPAQLGGAALYVSGGVGLRYLFRPMASVDLNLTQLAAELIQPGHVVWDIGANVGLLSFAAAGLAGKTGQVFAVEPDTWLVALLRRSAKLQTINAAPVQIIPTAIAADVNLRSFSIATKSRATNYLTEYGTTQTGGASETQTVITVTLDWLAERIPLPNIIKIDVEGAEFEVLSGAKNLLSTHRPIVICEVGSERAQAVGELLRTHDYRILDGDLPAAARVELMDAPWNTLAVPR